jgi:hypothetical protein
MFERRANQYRPQMGEESADPARQPEQLPRGGGSKSVEPQPGGALPTFVLEAFEKVREEWGSDTRELEVKLLEFEAGLPPPMPTEEYFREIWGVIARRRSIWNARKRNRDINTDEAEKYLHAADVDARWLLRYSAPERREAFYIRRTIEELKGFWYGSQIIAAASLIQEEYLEKMRPYDPQFIDEILTALPNHPASRAKSERIMRGLNRCQYPSPQ